MKTKTLTYPQRLRRIKEIEKMIECPPESITDVDKRFVWMIRRGIDLAIQKYGKFRYEKYNMGRVK